MLAEKIMNLGVGVMGLALLFAGCGPLPPSIPKEPIYRSAIRQLPPKATYHRLRWAHLPDLKPLHVSAPRDEVPSVLPILNLDVKDVTLEEAGRVLAATTRYATYCTSSIAKRKISLNAVGTIDELAAQLGKQAQVHSYVDHDNREIRFLTEEGSTQVSSEEISENEH